MKQLTTTLNASPTKNIYRSIIADYDLNLAICELIDNAVDLMSKQDTKKTVTVQISLDHQRKTIDIVDDAGGVEKGKIVMLVGPGQSDNVEELMSIGLFGVGSKRAVVALAENVRIKSRFHDGETYLIEYDDDWLKSDDWEIPLYKTDNIREGTTHIELSKLRISMSDDDELELIIHLSEVYSKFIEQKTLIIIVNDYPVEAAKLDKWAYPDSYEPVKFNGEIKHGNYNVDVQIIVGLFTNSSASGGL